MKTTLDLPDDLVRTLEVRAAREEGTLNDLAADLLRRGLAQDEPGAEPGHLVQLPLVRSPHPAPPDEELTPERVAEVLLAQEVEGAIFQ